MISHIVFGEAVLVIAPHHRVPQMQILDLGLQFVRVLLGDPPAEDHGELVRPADVAVGIQQPFSHFIERRALPEDQIVAVLDLGKEQLVPAACLPPFFSMEEGDQPIQPLVPAPGEIVGREESAIFCKASGSLHRRKALALCWKRMPACFIWWASQWC